MSSGLYRWRGFDIAAGTAASFSISRDFRDLFEHRPLLWYKKIMVGPLNG
jgi:hypothetical protein